MLPMIAMPREMPRLLQVVVGPEAAPAFWGGTEPTIRLVVNAVDGATAG
ncbi:hypothetical protein ACIBQ1_37585 [Nonomuraea sp. NPDC050153]